jgi:26S proteasome regulatory subunit N10
VAILLDNTSFSIDGDFFPTRLDAQKLTVERYAQYLFSVSPSSEIALATLSSAQFGARISFTKACHRLIPAMTSITSSTGVILLATAIQWAIIALRHTQSEMRRILAFIGGPHDIVDEMVASEIAQLLSDAKVFLDLVVFGPDVDHIPLLKRLANGVGCVFLEVPRSNTVLSDDVLASSIGPGPNSRIQIAEYAKADPEFAQALSMSIEPPKVARQSLLGMLLDPSIVTARRPRAAKITRVRKPRKEGEGDQASEANANGEKK